MRQKNTGEMSVSILDSLSKSSANNLTENKKQTSILDDILGVNKNLVENVNKLKETVTTNLSTKQISNTSTISTDKLENIGTNTNALLSQLISTVRDQNLQTANATNSLKDEFSGFGVLAASVTNLMLVAEKSSNRGATNIKNTLTNLIDAIQPVLNKSKELQEGAMALSILSSSIMSFGMNLALSTPLYLIGVVGAGLAALNISILSFVISRIDAKAVDEGSRAVKQLGFAVLTMGLSIAAFAYIVDPVASLYVTASVLGISAAFFIISKMGNSIEIGAKSLAYTGLSLIMLGLGIAGFVALVQSPVNVLLVSLSVLVVGGAFFLLGKGATDISQGALSIGFSAIAIGMLGFGIGLFQSMNIEMSTILTLGLSVVVIGGAMFLAGKFAANIIVGSLAMTLASLPIILIGYALGQFQTNEIGLETIGIMGAAVVAVGGGMALAGAFAPFIMLGSVAMLLAGAAIAVLTSSLGEFKKLDFKEEDSKKLNLAMAAVRGAFTGGEGGGGILSSIGGFFSSVFDGSSMIINAAAMMVAGVAISNVSAGLTEFKKVDWQEDDSKALTSVFASIVKSFSIVSDKDLQKQYGINTTPEEIYFGVLSLSNAGTTITSLAQGVKNFANLTFDEYTFDKASNKLIVSGKTKLSSNDITTAGDNISKVIAVVGKSFAEVGRLEYGENSENDLLSVIFGGGYVSTGVSALSTAGRTIASLAQGVKDFANLTFTEYEVKGKELVPKSVKKLSDGEILNAGNNIAKIISVVGASFAEVGRLDAGEPGSGGILGTIFGGGGEFVRRGVEALRGSGKLIIDLGQGVKDFASLTLTEYDVQDVNGVPTIVPKKITKMSEGDFTLASTNISKIISTVAKVFAEVGVLNNGGSSDNSILNSIFGSGDVEMGVKALSGVGENLINIADAIPKYANLSFTKMGIKDINGTPTIVPESIVKMSDNDLITASVNISKILGIVAMSFAEVGKMAYEGSGWFSDGYVEYGVEALKGVGQNLGGIVDSIVKVAGMQVPVYGADGKVASYTSISDADLVKAGLNIKKMLDTTAKTFYEFGMEYGVGTDKYVFLSAGLSMMGKVTESYGIAVEKLTTKSADVGNLEATMIGFGKSIKTLTTSVLENFDITKNAEIDKQLIYFSKFVGDIAKISENSSNLTTIATSFDKISNSMKVFKDNINGLDLKKTELTNSIFNSLASLANVKGSVDGLARTLNESIKTSFDKMVELLQELSGNVETQTSVSADFTSSVSKLIPNTLQKPTDATTTPTQTTQQTNQTQQNAMNMQLLTDIDTTLKSISSSINRAINEMARR